MKIVCTQENLNKALQSIGRIPKKDSTLPILNNVLIEATNNSITLSATDLEIGIALNVRGKIEQEGSVTVPAQLLAEYIATLPHQNVELSAVNESVKIACGAFASTILGMKRDDFPLIPKVEEGKMIRVKAGLFKAQLAQTIAFAASDETRPEIAGIYLTVGANKLILAATDGYRLAESQVSLEASNLMSSVIVPRQTLIELNRILDNNGEVAMLVSESQISFAYDEAQLVSRLIEGTYPSYKDLVPKDFETEVEVPKSELVHTVRATSLFGKHNVQDIIVEIKKDEIHFSSQANQVGESHATVAVPHAGSNNSITFNARYLLEGIASLSGEKVIMYINSATEPAILKSKDVDGYFYLIMPIKHT